MNLFNILLISFVISSLCYNEDLAITLYGYCELSYCPNEVIQNYNCGSFCDESYIDEIYIYTNDDYGTKSYSMVDYTKNNTIIFAFRGSDNFENYIYDIKLIQYEYPYCDNCQVHQGFYESYLSLSNLIYKDMDYYQNLIDKGLINKVYITGHSLGASIATFMYNDLTTNYKSFVNSLDVFELYTYGSPRNGNYEFATYVNKTLSGYRIVHYDDLVPHYPTQHFYYHIPIEIWYTDEDYSSYVICDMSGEDILCSNSVSPLYYSINDHHYFTYIYDETIVC